MSMVRLILMNPDHQQFMAALRWASENGYGKARESVDVTATGSLTLKVVHE